MSIVKGDNPPQMVEEALRLIGVKQLAQPKDSVFIKPNYVTAKHPSSGVTTDLRIVEAIIRLTQKSGARDISVGDGGYGNTERAFDVTGIRAAAQNLGVKLVNLNRDTIVQVKVPGASALHEAGIAEAGLECTRIINVPKLKVHSMALVTGCLKNMMGFIRPKNIMHSPINEKIVDLASLFRDKVSLNVVDGIVGCEEDEISGSPVEMNLVIAGADMVAVDAVASAVMGVDPTQVKYLRLAEERGLGTSNLDEIEIRGRSIREVAKRFRLPPFFT